MKACVTAASEQAFCALIQQRTGIVLQDHQMSNLQDTLHNGCAHFGYADCAQYLHALEQGHAAPLEYLISGVTVGESYFFRDSEQIELLRRELLPQMISAKRAAGDLSLRMWSAGCSHGQEIYTIALLLLELIPDIENWRIHLLGTDINGEAVTRAMRGRYSEWSFRATPAAVRERWFAPAGYEYEIHPMIRNMVRFAYLNLTVDAYPSILSETNAMDLILCRNVFIYLDRRAVRRCMAQYAHCLIDQGVLMLGASDPIDYKHAELRLIQNESAGYFRKFSPATNIAPAFVKPASYAPPLLQAPIFANVAVSREDFHDKVKPACDMDEIVRLLKNSAWSEALAKAEEACGSGCENGELWQVKAKALANLGHAEQALQACEHSIRLDPVNKHTYLIQGLILAELDRLPEAEAALRRTLYLDRSFLEAHYELGMLRVRAGDIGGALKSLGNALRQAQAGDPERELHNASGMTYGRFAEILKNEIGMLRDAR